MPYPKTDKGKKAATEAYKICSDKTGQTKEKCVMGVYNDKMSSSSSSSNNKGTTTTTTTAKGKKK